MREEDINRVESAECPATFLFQPRSQQSLDRCAERRQIKRLFDELERARRSAFRGNLGRDRAADHECARVRVRGANFLEEIRQARPRWIDIENEKLGIEIGSQLLGFGERTGDCGGMVRREFFFSAKLIATASASYSSRRRMLLCGISALADLRRVGTWARLRN